MGPHGLPLIGTGDWNDGMNRVGEHGRGESVWLGWFLHATLTAFAPLAQSRGELALAASWLNAGRRNCASRSSSTPGMANGTGAAFFDDGTPLGSAGNDECRIDSIAQSWSVISGAANPARAARAMAARRSAAHPARSDRSRCCSRRRSTKSAQEPGYIKAYPRGIRENGGQYTHAAIWTVIALDAAGQGRHRDGSCSRC